MSKQMNVDCFTTELYVLLRETFEQTQGIYLDRGTSLLQTLGTISAEQASRPVSPAILAHTSCHLGAIRQALHLVQ